MSFVKKKTASVAILEFALVGAMLSRVQTHSVLSEVSLELLVKVRFRLENNNGTEWLVGTHPSENSLLDQVWLYHSAVDVHHVSLPLTTCQRFTSRNVAYRWHGNVVGLNHFETCNQDQFSSVWSEFQAF